MDNLPNGFTGFAGVERPDDFESAAEASRKRFGSTAEPRHVSSASSASQPSSGPRHVRERDIPIRFEKETPFDQKELAAISAFDQRWAWVEIDLSAVRHNVAESRRFIHPRCHLMAVVKADAYGHGAVEVAKAVIGAGADRLGVATVPEGIALREAGITAPILVLSQPPAASAPLLLAYRLTPVVHEPSFAVAYGEVADMHGMRAPYHLALDTGMNRTGVPYDQAREFLYQVNFHRALVLEGVCTHYATADCPETLEFQRQTKRFVDAVTAIQAAGFDPGIVHASNSAAIYRFPDVQFDMVRQGISLYGIHPCPETRDLVELRPAMSVHARIVDTRMPQMSEGVSYGLHYRSPGSVKICTIPIGYADGLRLGLSGNIDFIMAGKYYRQVGNICMDHCMFEVDMRTYASRERIDPQVGDEVIVVGSQGIAEVTIDEMAEKLRTIPYELTIGFAQRLPRMFK